MMRYTVKQFDLRPLYFAQNSRPKIQNVFRHAPGPPP